MSVWRAFKSPCERSGKQAVFYTKFINLWEQFHPKIVVAKPMTNLCLTCQQNTSKLLRSANLLDREKSQCILAQQEHLNCVQRERDLYRYACTESKNNFERLADSIELYEQHEECSLTTTIHYSFDFAQQIHIPSNPMQPGPIYFKTPRKCGIFGVMCEAIPRQVNYLIDEASDVGKGANTTISYVHHYFQNHSLGETHAIFMQIIVLDRTRTTSSSGTWHGEQFTSFMSQSFILFSSPVTQSLAPIDASE